MFHFNKVYIEINVTFLTTADLGLKLILKYYLKTIYYNFEC